MLLGFPEDSAGVKSEAKALEMEVAWWRPKDLTVAKLFHLLSI